MIVNKSVDQQISAVLVSAVITTYNRPEKLLQAVQSVLDQSYKNIEIIIIDDCSSLPYRDILSKLSNSIRYVRLAENSGASAARNEGVRQARGKYIAFLDDDDIWLPNKTMAQLQAIAGRDICLCGLSIVQTGKLKVKKQEVITLKMLLERNIVCGCSGVFAKRKALQAEPFDEKLTNSEDWDLFIRFSKKDNIAYVPQPLYSLSDGDHQRITNKVKSMSVEQLDPRLNALRKHRKLIGESNYKKQVAGTILAYIRQRKDKTPYIKYCLQQAGLIATLTYLIGKFCQKLSS